MTIKIEAAKRLQGMPQPPWYARCMKQVPQYKAHLENLTLPFPRTDLKVQDQFPKTVGDWGGNWSVDFSGHITIYLQTSFYKACMKAGLLWALVHVVQHEYVEAKLTIGLARKKYPNDSPYIMAERDQGLGGEAHYLAIKELDGISESAYDKGLDMISKYLRSLR